MDAKELLAVILLGMYCLSYALDSLVLRRKRQEREKDGDGKWI